MLEIYNYIDIKLFGIITPCFTFNGTLPIVKEWRSNNILPKNIDVIIYPYPNVN